MSLARRPSLPAALLVLLALLLLAAGGARAAETCTTAIGGDLPDRPADAPFADTCAAAVLVVSPNPAEPGAVVRLDGSQSVGGDIGDEIARYDWTFGDGAFDQTLAPTSSVTHVYARGPYRPSLTILDGDGLPLEETSVELIVGSAPVAALSAPSGVLRPGVAYEFDASASSSPDLGLGGRVVRYDWDWGDGTTSPDGGPTLTHTFTSDVSAQVTVTVIDDLGLQARASRAVTVLNQLPLVQLLAAPATVQVGEQLRLDASGTSDPDGTIVEYRWDLDANGTFERSTGTTPSATAGGYPNPGPLALRVKAIDDSGGSSVKGVTVTVARPPASGGGSSGRSGGTGTGSGSGGSGSGGPGSGSGSGSGGDGTGGGSGGDAGDPFAVGLSGAAIQRLTGALRRGIGLQAVANRAANGTLTLSVSAKDAAKLRLPGRKGKRPVAIGTLRLALRAGRTAKPAIKLTAAAARALRRAKPRTLRVTIRGSLAAGADSAAVVRVVLLRG
jgi:large repetitive protein